MINLIILQSNAPGLFGQFIPLILVLFIIYFFFIRPQAKKQKEQMAFQNQLNKGDEVVTASGIIGRVNKIDDNIITLQIDQKTFIKVFVSSVSKEMTDHLQVKSNEPISKA